MVTASIVDLIRAIRGRSRQRGSAGSYQPEKHYMRGRGPAWAGKHGDARDPAMEAEGPAAGERPDKIPDKSK